MPEAIRTVPSSEIRTLSECWNEIYPHLIDWVPRQVKGGLYAVVDENGKRLPINDALDIIYGRK